MNTEELKKIYSCDDNKKKIIIQAFENFMLNKWIPTFMDKFIKNTNVLKEFDNAKDDYERAELIEDFNEAASEAIIKKYKHFGIEINLN